MISIFFLRGVNMTIDDCYDKIQELSGVSDLIAQYIDAQLYRMEFDTEDQIGPQDLMIKCYGILLGELKQLGIDLIVDFDEALASIYQADGYVALYQLLNIDYLKSLFTLYTDAQDMIRNVFDTDDSDNDIETDESTFLSDFLIAYRQFNPQDELLQKIERIEDTVVSSVLFKKHIEAILEDCIPQSSISSDNIGEISKYIEKIVEGRNLFAHVIRMVLKFDSSLNLKYLSHAAQLYDLEKVTGTDIAKYCWAVMSNDSTLSEQEKKLKAKILDTHTRNQTHHIEYYIYNQIKPTKENLVELTAHHIEPDSTRDLFIKSVKLSR